jgi:hypothetical protein
MSSTELAKRICSTRKEKPEAEFNSRALDGYARHRMQVCTECHAMRLALGGGRWSSKADRKKVDRVGA